MTLMKDITGMKFGKLIVLERSGYLGRQMAYRCRCDCGNEKVIRGVSLRYGVTKSCGCLMKEAVHKSNSKPFGESAFNTMYQHYKVSAARANRAMDLTKEEFREIIFKPCFYCGAEPTKYFKVSKANGNIKANGIDRVDNSIGYTLNNVVPCCIICNRAKHSLSVDEWNAWLYRVSHYQISRELSIEKHG